MSQFLPLKVPPGMRKVGTDYSAKGRYVDGNLVRWRDGVLRPWGGWAVRSATSGAISGIGRCIEVWRDNNNQIWIAVGSEQGLWIQSRSGYLYDITPTGFKTGIENAVSAGGYGAGPYGVGTYGSPRPTLPTDNVIVDVTTWALDTFGPYLVGVDTNNQTIYEWTLSASAPATPLENAPSALSLIVTADHMIMALGANGDPRQVAWCDQTNNTDWTPSNTNTAGSNELSTNGRLMCGRNIQGGTLLFTDVDLWLSTLVPNELIYAFSKVGDSCGIISRNAAMALGAQAMWMGENGFYYFNGAVVEPIDCEVADWVFGNLNYLQKSKVIGFFNSLFNEATWYFQSNAGTEIDSYVTYNVIDQWWATGSLSRVGAIDRGALNNPLMVGADGNIYQHEYLFDWSGDYPFATTGPIQLGNGDVVSRLQGLIPDDETLGAVTATITGKMYPDDSYSITTGTLTLANKTDFRLTARQVEVTYTASAQADFRVGEPRLIITAGGRR